MFKQHQLTNAQYNVLRILRGQLPNPATVNLIIDRMLDRMSNVSRIIDKLVAKKNLYPESKIKKIVEWWTSRFRKMDWAYWPCLTKN